MEEKYWELREAWDRAVDELYYSCSEENFKKAKEAETNFFAFCQKVLEKLMDENSDVLARLK